MKKLFVVLCFSVSSAIFITGAVEVAGKYLEKEKAVLEKLRTELGDALYKDYMKSDLYLSRWLRASNFDLHNAMKALNRTMNWRKANKVDGIINEHILEFSHPVYEMDGAIARNGGFFLISRGGKIRYRDILLNRGQNHLTRKFIQFFEHLEIETLKAMGVIGNSSRPGASELSTVIWDMDGFSLRQHLCPACIGQHKEHLQTLISYYPGYVGVYIVINYPRIARPFQDVIQPLAKLASRNGIFYYGSNKAEWFPVLKKIAAPDQLKRYLGGTRE